MHIRRKDEQAAREWMDGFLAEFEQAVKGAAGNWALSREEQAHLPEDLGGFALRAAAEQFRTPGRTIDVQAFIRARRDGLEAGLAKREIGDEYAEHAFRAHLRGASSGDSEMKKTKLLRLAEEILDFDFSTTVVKSGFGVELGTDEAPEKHKALRKTLAKMEARGQKGLDFGGKHYEVEDNDVSLYVIHRSPFDQTSVGFIAINTMRTERNFTVNPQIIELFDMEGRRIAVRREGPPGFRSEGWID